MRTAELRIGHKARVAKRVEVIRRIVGVTAERYSE